MRSSADRSTRGPFSPGTTSITTVKKPVVVGDAIVIGQRMNLTLSGDHRVVDGATGAQYLAALKNLLEKPALLLL